MSRETMDQSEQHERGFLEPILAEHAAGGRSGLVPVLLRAQSQTGYLTPPMVEAIGRALRVPLSEIHGVIEFYTMLYNQPAGRQAVRVCTRPICDQAGGPEPIGLGLVGGMARPLSGRCGIIDPADLAGFEAHGGFGGLRRALESLTPAQVIAEIKTAGRSGRGGAAFPTGTKWAVTAGAPGGARHVVR